MPTRHSASARDKDTSILNDMCGTVLGSASLAWPFSRFDTARLSSYRVMSCLEA